MKTLDREMEIWKEMIELIPKMQKSVDLGLERHMTSRHHELKDSKEHLVAAHQKKTEAVKQEISELKSSFEIFQGRYTLEIIFVLSGMKDPYFNQIKKALVGINSGTLSNRLKFLESKDILIREVEMGQPIRVKYMLTPKGWGIFKLLLPLLIYSTNFEAFSSSSSDSSTIESNKQNLDDKNTLT